MTTDLSLLVDRATTIIRRRFSNLASLYQPIVVKDKTRSLVVRCSADWPVAGHAPVGSVIIKYMRDDLARGFTEWASREFLADLPDAHDLVPRFLGGDIEHRLVILEDLGGSSNLPIALGAGKFWATHITLGPTGYFAWQTPDYWFRRAF